MKISDRHPVVPQTPSPWTNVLPQRGEYPGMHRVSDAATVRATGAICEPEPTVKIAAVPTR